MAPTTRARPRNAHTRGRLRGQAGTFARPATGRVAAAGRTVARALVAAGRGPVATTIRGYLAHGHTPYPVRLWPTWVMATAMAAATLLNSAVSTQWRIVATAGLVAFVLGGLVWLPMWIGEVRNDRSTRAGGHGTRTDRRGAAAGRKLANTDPTMATVPWLAIRWWLAMVAACVATVAWLGWSVLMAACVAALWLARQAPTMATTSDAAMAKRNEAWRALAAERGAEAIRVRWSSTVANARWGGHKGGTRGPLVGTSLSGVEVGDDGSWWAVVNLGAGNATWETVAKSAEIVAKVYDVRPAGVHVVPGKTAARAKIGVLRSDPLEAAMPWRKPTMSRHGRLTVGMYADGEPGVVNLWHGDEGAVHGLIAGSTRAGKSGPSQLFITEGILSRKVWPVVADPDSSSLKGVRERVDHYVSETEDCLRLIKAVHDVMIGRMRAGLADRAPSRTHPVLLLIVEELHTLLSDKETAKEVLKWLPQITKRGAKVNVAVIGVVQQPSVREFADDSALRAQLMGGNLFVFRTSDRAAGSMALSDKYPGLYPERIPRAFPSGKPTRGLGYMPGEEGRLMAFRSGFMDAKSWEEFDRLDAAAAKPRAALEPRARRIFDAVMLDEQDAAEVDPGDDIDEEGDDD